MPRPATTQDTAAFQVTKGERTRYGNYLDMYTSKFTEDGAPTTDPVEFARHAFTIAAVPIMSPGYVIHHGRVVSVGWRGDENYRTAIELGLVVPMPPAIAEVVSRTPVHGWTNISTWWEAGGRAERWYKPEDNDRPSVFTTLTCRVPIDSGLLPKPRYTTGGAPILLTAEHAVRAVCQIANDFVRPILTVLEGVTTGA